MNQARMNRGERAVFQMGLGTLTLQPAGYFGSAKVCICDAGRQDGLRTQSTQHLALPQFPLPAALSPVTGFQHPDVVLRVLSLP